jgi:hypothetical protein
MPGVSGSIGKTGGGQSGGDATPIPKRPLMKAISRFPSDDDSWRRSFLMSIVALVYLLNKVFDFARGTLKSLAKMIPDQVVSRTTIETIMAIV